MRLKLSLFAVVVSVAAALLTAPAAVGADEPTPGTRPDLPAASTQSAHTPIAPAPVAPVVTESGLISLSVDAVGSNSTSGLVLLTVEKPAGATVRSAYVAAASTGFRGYVPQVGDVTLDGEAVVWDESMTMENTIGSVNVWADVTDMVKPKIDAAAPGRIGFAVTEGDVTLLMEGSILAVIFDDPNVTLNSTIVLAYGAQQVTGDTITLVRPPTVPSEDVEVRLGLGISYGFQPSLQDSTVTVNGELLTSSAGGQDDGTAANGALITVGGLDDDPANPPDPTSRGLAPDCPRCDDELYDLTGFVGDGALSTLELATANPTEDDNIFFAALEVVGAQADWDPEGLRYNEVRQKSSHNSYERREAIMDQLVYHRVRSVELDIHNRKDGQRPRAGDWFVYHDELLPGRSQTTCNRLSNCLQELSAFHSLGSNHEVVTVFIDLKDISIYAFFRDFWQSGRRPADLDALLTNSLGRSRIYTPGDLIGSCDGETTLTGAVARCGWPTVDELRGKFMFVITGPDDGLFAYTESSAEAQTRTAFIAPNLESEDRIGEFDYAIFFNMDGSEGDQQHAAAVRRAGYVGRVYDLNSQSLYVSAETADAHHLGTNNVNSDRDPWSKTHDPVTGWPFGLFDGEPATETEQMQALGADVTTGDIWSDADDFVFAYRTDAGTAVWEASVSSPNSHVHQWAKGCLMARETLDPSSAYFAVCRPADKQGTNGIGGNKGRLRVQYRDSADRGTRQVHVDILEQDEGEDAIDEESLTFIRLEVRPDNNGTCATGYGSQNGVDWVEIEGRCFDESLELVGVATSSHGEDPVKFIYSVLRRWGAPVVASDLTVVVVGGGAGQVFDGFCSPSRGC